MCGHRQEESEHNPGQWYRFDVVCGVAGVLAARAASTVTGRASEDTGIRIESIIKAGLTGPMAEALAMYYQV